MTASQEKPRLYFDCPLKAAWMAKHLGMKFQDYDWSLDLLDCLDGAKHDRHYVIHADSLPLLNPIDGDVIHRTNGYHQMVGFNIGVPKAAAQLAAGGVIIQRAGKPFFWPESEAA